MANIIFIIVVGYSPKENYQKGNLYLKEHYPYMFEHLDIIGFRSNIDFQTYEEEAENLKYTYIAYVAYFLMSIYIVNRQKEMLEISKRENNF
jgi:hypothetical protein